MGLFCLAALKHVALCAHLAKIKADRNLVPYILGTNIPFETRRFPGGASHVEKRIPTLDAWFAGKVAKYPWP
jgi:hypothetical protein